MNANELREAIKSIISVVDNKRQFGDHKRAFNELFTRLCAMDNALEKGTAQEEKQKNDLSPILRHLYEGADHYDDLGERLSSINREFLRFGTPELPTDMIKRYLYLRPN
jgi:septation ring formation regulator EzrA